MKKRVISTLIILAMIFTGMEPAFAARSAEPLNDTLQNENRAELFASETAVNEPDPLDLESGNIVIDQPGNYIIQNVDQTSNTITVSATGVRLTIKNVTMTGAATAPIKVMSGAELTLNAEGENNITSARNFAGIAVYANDTETNYGTLILEGNGVLNVKSSGQAPAIGTNKSNSDASTGITGKIIINSGTINATGTGVASVGIGSPNSTSSLKSCDIEINGGIITAKGGANAAGIGGVNSAANGNITINGGTVIADGTNVSGIGPGSNAAASDIGVVTINGGSVKASISDRCAPVKNGMMLKPIIIQSDDLKNQKVTNDLWSDGAEAIADADGKLYVYVPLNTKAYGVKKDNVLYYVTGIQNEDTYTLTKYEDGPCICTHDNSSLSLTLANIDDEVSVNTFVNKEIITPVVQFNTASGCTYPIHLNDVSYSLTVDGAAPNPSLAEIQGEDIVVYAAANGSELSIQASAEVNGNIYTTTPKVVRVVTNNTAKFDISKGNITITSADSENYNITVGSDNYSVPKTNTIYIYQSGKESSNKITVGANASVSIENLNLKTVVTEAINIDDNVHLNLLLKGKNTIYSQNDVISAYPDTSSITVEGDGSLDISSASKPAISNIKTLTVNSGVISAHGGTKCAGIGGDETSKGFDVVVNGGIVNAYGNYQSPGIGGGSQSDINSRGTLTVNGGAVFASIDEKQDRPNLTDINSTSIEINGGSVKANEISLQDKYLVTLSVEDITESTEVSYTIEDGSAVTTYTDETGKLYLYLPVGRQQIKVYKDGNTYFRYTEVAEENSTEPRACVLNSEVQINDVKVPGQIGDAVVNGDTWTIKVPNGINFDSVTVIIDYIGSDVNDNDSIDFTNDTHTVQYKLYGNEKQEKIITITLEEEAAPEGPTSFNIALGSIVIEDNYVYYGGVEYVANPKGYIITGTTNKNSVSIDTYDTQTPPITFKDVNITSAGAGLSVSNSANITLEGINTITSSSNAVEMAGAEDVISVTFTGADNDAQLKISGNTNAVNLSGANMTINDITADITASGGAAIEGSGTFTIGNTDKYIHISGTETGIQPVSANGDGLYQMTVNINAEDKTKNVCEYNNKQYYVGNDNILYLMVQNGTYNVTVSYNGDVYEGSATVSNGPESVDLVKHEVKVTKVTPPADNVLSCSGGVAVITVEGSYVDNAVQIILKDIKNADNKYSATVQKDGSKSTAKVTLPANDDEEKDVTYIIYYSIGGKETNTGQAIIVNRNNTVCNITNIEIDGQIGNSVYSTSGKREIFTAYMPYDHQLKTGNTYKAKTIEYKGKSVSPALGTATEFTYNSSSKYCEKVYEVVANDNTTRKEYTVRLYNQTAPKVTSFNVNKTSLTNEDRVVTVTLSGTDFANLANAEQENNKKIFVYADGINPVEATENNGAYTAEITVPQNTTQQQKTYTLRAKIGETVQTPSRTVTLAKADNNEAFMTSFELPDQVSVTSQANGFKVLMPYNADITSLTPAIECSSGAVYSPTGAQNFTNPVTYTVTAENGIATSTYTINVTKEPAPEVTSVSFTNPSSSSESVVKFTIEGNNLSSLENAVSGGGNLTVKCTPSEGTPITGTAVKQSNGKYEAALTIPANTSTASDSVYTVSVELDGQAQTLTGETQLTVPRMKSNACDITGFTLTEDQADLVISENTITLKVPYNTDLRSIEPQITNTGVSVSPKGKQNFNNPVTYTVTAENGTTKDYTVTVSRAGQAGISEITFSNPSTSKAGNVEITIIGNFVEDIGDSIAVTVTPQNGGSAINADINYTEYGGKATASVTLPQNNDEAEQKYTISVMLNGSAQTISNNTITVPQKRPCSIGAFKVPNQVGTSVITESEAGNTISFKVPYGTNLKAITPVVEIEGDGYTPTGEQNFTVPVIYTVHEDDQEKRYTVTAEYDGKPSIKTVTLKNTPASYKGGKVQIELDGIFLNAAKVKAIPSDGGNAIEADMTVSETGLNAKASAEITIPSNESLTNEREYTLEFYLDGNTAKTEYEPASKITVPKKNPCSITSFKVLESTGEINGNTITIKLPYGTDFTSIMPTVTIEGTRYEPTEAQDFTNPVEYTVYAGEDKAVYTVTAIRDGKPSIKTVTLKNTPASYRGGKVQIELDGIFLNAAKVKAIPSDGGNAIEANMTVSEMGKASAEITIPSNESLTNEQEYTLEFYLDGNTEKTEYEPVSKIIIPRHSQCEMVSFALPNQDGETRFEGTDIYIDMPYYCDLTSIVPSIEYYGDSISPSADAAQDFTNPVVYTITSAGDTETYTVHVTSVGTKPSIKKFSVENQTDDTIFDNDTINITMPSKTDLTQITPIVEFEGVDYSPKGPQDFSQSSTQPIIYTAVDKYGMKAEYKVTIVKKRRGGSGINYAIATSVPTATPAPEPSLKPTEEPIKPIETQQPTAKPETQSPYMSGYEENGARLFKPHTSITRAEVAVILSNLDKDFDINNRYAEVGSDINAGIWYAQYMNFAIAKGYISGYDDNTYRPDNNITRAEFASLIARYINLQPDGSENVFDDTDSVPWCLEQINALVNMGIISGYEDGTFRPSNNVTRSEAAAIINRVLKRDAEISGIVCPFEDVLPDFWAYNDIIKAACEF